MVDTSTGTTVTSGRLKVRFSIEPPSKVTVKVYSPNAGVGSAWNQPLLIRVSVDRSNQSPVRSKSYGTKPTGPVTLALVMESLDPGRVLKYSHNSPGVMARVAEKEVTRLVRAGWIVDQAFPGHPVRMSYR